jgi:hypothetical protein
VKQDFLQWTERMSVHNSCFLSHNQCTE